MFIILTHYENNPLSNHEHYNDTLASRRFVRVVTRSRVSSPPGAACVRSEAPTGHFRVRARPPSLPSTLTIYTSLPGYSIILDCVPWLRRDLPMSPVSTWTCLVYFCPFSLYHRLLGTIRFQIVVKQIVFFAK